MPANGRWDLIWPLNGKIKLKNEGKKVFFIFGLCPTLGHNRLYQHLFQFITY